MMLSGLKRRWQASILSGIALIWVSGSHSAAPPFQDSSLAGLINTEERILPANPYQGRYRLVLFGFTSCADVCPLTLLALREAVGLLGEEAGKVVPIFISVDPERDQPESLARYVRAFDSRIQGLTGPPDVLARVAAGHGVFFEKRWVHVSNNVYVFDHTASVLVIGPDGRLIASVSTVGAPTEVAERIVAALPRPLR